MSNCTCFRCQRKYSSPDPDDVAGDGRCPDCKELGKRAAFKVDIEMANKRQAREPSRIRQIFTEEEIRLGDTAGAAKRIRLADLGIVPQD